MKKITIRGLLCIVSAFVLLLSVVGLPAEAKAAQRVSIEDYDMVKYFSLSSKGTIIFDASAARCDGVDPRVIDGVGKRIASMNTLVSSGVAYINGEYSAVVCSSRMVTRAAVGENKVEMSWDGTTMMYMDSEIAENLYNNLMNISSTTANVVNDQLLEDSGVSPVTIATFGISIYFLAYASQVRVAKEPGRGIILNYKYDYIYMTESYWFTSQ